MIRARMHRAAGGRSLLAAGAALAIVAAGALWYALGRQRASAPVAGGAAVGPPAADLPRQPAHEIGLAPAVPPAERADAAAQPSAGERSAAAWLEARTELEQRIEELRRIAEHADYHARAWPIVQRIASVVSALDETGRRDSAERLRAVEADTATEHERVRGACLLALATATIGGEADFGGASALAAQRTRDASPELRRAALLALSLRATEPGAPAIPLARYDHWTELTTYPVVLDHCLPQEDAALAAALWGAALPPIYLEELPMTRPDVQDDQLAREIAVLVDLGPRAGRPGPARERLLALATGAGSIEWLVRHAARFALALAARADAELAELLLDLAVRLGNEGNGHEILHLLATEAGRGELVFGALQEVLETASADTDPLAQAEALETLTFLIRSGGEELRASGTDTLVGHLLDPSKSEFEVMVFLNRLELTDAGVAFDVGRALLATESSPEKLEHVLPSLGHAPDDRKAAARELLLGYDATEQPAGVRKARMLGIARLRDPRDAPYLAELAASDSDQDVRAYATQLLAKFYGNGG